MAINFAAASTAGLNNPGTEIITLVKDGSGNFINPPSYDKMREYLRSGEVPMLFVTDEAGETGSLYQLVEYSETENKIRFSNDVSAIEFCAGCAAPTVSDVVPKPLTYDYMPEGYPKKSGWRIEWDGNTDGLVSVAGQFYKVSDMEPTDTDLIGATMETSAGESSKLSSALINAITEDITVIGEGFAVIARKDNATFNNVPFPQKGTYFSSRRGVFTSKLDKQTTMPMAEEFMPVLTAPNGTKYKITVDDSGTISATEVT